MRSQYSAPSTLMGCMLDLMCRIAWKVRYVMSMVFLRKFGLNEAKRVYCGIPGGEPLNKCTYCKENVEYISIILTIYHN